MKDWIENTINPPGITRKNRLSLFQTIGGIADIVRTDALKAFNAHFPYVADSVKLEEHGTALLIPHLLHDTEKEYRDRVSTASFFLMRSGERAYILEQLKEHFSDRYKVIEQFLNVHLKVSDLTDEEREWSLGLLDSLLNPNIYMELSEWFHYSAFFPASDAALYTFERQDIDLFDDPLLRDGRILRDGRTVYNAKMDVLRNGLFKRDGGINRSGEYSIPDSNVVRLPIRRGYRMRDQFEATFKKAMTDTQTAKLLRNGLLLRDGSVRRHGWIETALDAIPPFAFFSAETEQLPLNDVYPTIVKKAMSDIHANSVKRDGARTRDGMLQRANLLDTSILNFRTVPMSDTAAGLLKRNGMIRRDGSENRSGLGGQSIYEMTPTKVKMAAFTEAASIAETARMAVGNNTEDVFINTKKRDGALVRDGATSRSNYIIDAFASRYTLTGFEDAVGMVEGFVLGKRYHHFRDGQYARDGTILRNSMMLIPLE